MAGRKGGTAKKDSISNPDKVLYPAAKFTKADVADYYRRAAPFLLPHFHNRPVTLKRYPEGVRGDAFYEKDAPGFKPEWVKTFPIPRHEGGPDIHYVVLNDVRSLLWAANAAALELHPFLHRVPDVARPTCVVFDLDPGDDASIVDCAEVAVLLRDVLTQLSLNAFPKASGSKGIQLYVPLNTPVTYSATQPFARAMAQLLEKTHPKQIVADMARNLRVGKVFIDWSQNADHKTTIGVYSLRAKREHPYVSMPITWEEIDQLRQMRDPKLLDFLPDAALQRLSKVGDLFAPLLKAKQKLPEAFASLAESRRRKRPKSLSADQGKRNFSRTKEPAAADVPRRSTQGSRRRFVVQKHAASHLHYDFRLEMHDVLKSWAVPKGVPMTQGETRSAFETEDHPIEYLQFEGIIPEGEYGGGTVMVWDIGTYEVVEGSYWKGAVTVFLIGKKLKGEWTLQRTEGRGEKRKWLLQKTNGDAKPIAKQRGEISALSGRTMEKIAGDKSAVWNSDRAQEQAHESRPKRDSPRVKFVKPMKATAVTQLPEGDEWIYELKWDGYRVLAAKQDQNVRLFSLKENDLSTDFPAVAEAVRDLKAGSALVDGEVVAVNASGCPSFQALQNRASLGRGWQIVYYAFDLLNLEGEDWTGRPLHERKTQLRAMLEGSAVRYSAELPGNPADIVATIQSAGLEGVIAKKRDSIYRAGTRVTSWIKFKIDKSQEFVIGGYKPDHDTFQSVLVGYYEGKNLTFAGKVRQGFNPAIRRRLLDSMRPLEATKCPFQNLATTKKSHFGEGITTAEMKQLVWLKPRLVAQVSFTEWTNYGLLRHATYKGLRDDKEPTAIVRELM